MTTEEMAVAEQAMRIMLLAAEELGLAWKFYKAKGKWHIEVEHAERGFVLGVGHGDTFDAARANLVTSMEKRAQAVAQEKRRMIS